MFLIDELKKNNDASYDFKLKKNYKFNSEKA